ncbi:MAG: hypothetical protein CVU36_18465 [Betaproteobacteria bacterium HGW-Betaproteobacteria-9]|jgi:hypothetical protein|nr:hypothetical protein [Hydrogenophaga sp.]PKO27947.1 MAG: hypothetical protein CVU36_18465 [Betaproteobacteria bacterium HGW-Betaproteobacteria-9]
MSQWIQALLAVAVTGVAFSATAQQAAEHAQHHPATASVISPSATAIQQVSPQAGMSMGMSSMPQMQQHMQQHMASMQALHTRMTAATTVDEREALMADHTKAMHEGMNMMMQRMPAAALNGTWRWCHVF